MARRVKRPAEIARHVGWSAPDRFPGRDHRAPKLGNLPRPPAWPVGDLATILEDDDEVAASTAMRLVERCRQRRNHEASNERQRELIRVAGLRDEQRPGWPLGHRLKMDRTNLAVADVDGARPVQKARRSEPGHADDQDPDHEADSEPML